MQIASLKFFLLADKCIAKCVIEREGGKSAEKAVLHSADANKSLLSSLLRSRNGWAAAGRAPQTSVNHNC